MGSVAQDGSGNIGLGFSVSSSTTFPGIRYTGHLTTDAPGVMGQGEGVLVNGAGSQLPSLGRWGDYSSLTVDPLDDCTFWYTNEYLAGSGTFNWHTRIGTFRLPGCGVPDFALSASPPSVTVNPGQAATYTVTITPQGGYGGTPTLSVSGLPAGASGSFSPIANGTSTLTVTTDAATPVNSYPLTVAGTDGALTHTAGATLVVAGPDYSLTASPTTRSVTQGQSTTYAIGVSPIAGFNGSVPLGASSLAGTTITFSPPSASPAAGSTMTVTTSTSTPIGNNTITITGSDSAHTTTVTLSVQTPAPDFTISAAPSSRSVVHGSSTTYTVTIGKVNAFSGSVTLSVSGLPSRATATLSPNPTTSSSTLTVSTRSRTPVGTSILTITGTSGTLSHKTTVTLKTT
jgi:hypothetical protein